LKTDDLPRSTIALARAAAPGCTIVAFHPDDPFNAHRIRGPSHPRALSQMREVDHYFIWSERIVQRVRHVSTTAVSYLGFACDPAFTRPIPLLNIDRVRFGADISFIGNWTPKREAWLAPLAQDTKLTLAIWGESDWQNLARDPSVKACWRGAATGDDFVRAVLCSRASVNILRPQNESAENMRTYEIPACGGILLAEWSAQQSRIFREGVEAFYAKSPTELVDRARYAVHSPRESRTSLSIAALQRASEHTYSTRAQTIIDTLREPVTLIAHGP
jgi:spore maturation protein CgeB